MPRARSRPPQLPAAFTVAAAVALGVTPGSLSRNSLSTPFHGVRIAAPVEASSDLRRAAGEYAPRLRAGQFFSHETALGLIGAPMPEWPYRPRLHVATHRPAREPRTRGVIGHRLQVRDSAALIIAPGMAVEHPVRAWRQVGISWSLGDLVAAGDFLVSGEHPWATADELRAEVEAMGDLRGNLLRRALEEVRIGPRSARETKLRRLLLSAGLPEPEINWTLRDAVGRPVAELDLAYPRWRVAPEYDGRVHADDPVQFAKDGDRWDRIRAQGWDHVRILNHHMRHGGGLAVAKVRDALAKAGWSPAAHVPLSWASGPVQP